MAVERAQIRWFCAHQRWPRYDQLAAQIGGSARGLRLVA
jgi:hypothetical protein